MATTKNTRPTRQSNTGNFGLLANGSSGPWEIAIDETTSGADRWYAQIEGPSVSFYFEIPSVDVVGKMVRFLDPRQAPRKEVSLDSMERNGSLVIGKDKKTPIALVKDDEYEDRFFLVVGPMDSPLVRFVIAGTDVAKIADALRQVKQDLDDED
jgi:hypothetical protein